MLQHSPGVTNTGGIIPFLYVHNNEEQLVIIEGGIQGKLFKVIYGRVYTYENFIWPPEKVVTKEKCVEVAERNRKDHPNLIVHDDVAAQFKQLFQ